MLTSHVKHNGSDADKSNCDSLVTTITPNLTESRAIMKLWTPVCQVW